MPTKRKTKKTKKVTKPKVVVEEVVEEVVVEEPVKVKRTRRVVTRETVLEGFETLMADVNTEVTNLKATVKKGKTGVRFLKHVNTRLRQLYKDSARVMKKKRASTRTNSNSGFMKPVEISSEMRKFTGWDDEPKSRVQVTKYICDYIKKNELQNPADRREIKPNSQLKKLLRLKGEQATPLTYYSLQKHIQHHFHK